MSKEINVKLRLINIKQEKVLLMYNSEEDYYFYMGGTLEFGETIEQGAKREVREECGEDVIFELEKVLYIRDYVAPIEDTHNVELFILGNINKFEELEGKEDPEFKGRDRLTWKNIDSLPANVYPTTLSQKLAEDYRNGFPNQGEYLGNIT